VGESDGLPQSQVSWPGLIGPSMKEMKISVAYWMAGSSPAMTIEAAVIFSHID
jgi:hypothetical protein